MRVALGGDDQLQAALEPVDGVIPVDDSETADLVVAVGEEPLRESAARREERPVLSVGLAAAWSCAAESLPEVLGRVGDRPLPTVEAAPLVVSADGTQSTAAFDATLVTSEPARISEYAVSVAGRPHATFRADGVVVATPLGSHSYARAAGGPQLAFGTGLAVVPIAPFATIADTWVVEPPVSVSVEREDAVTVLADDARIATGRAELTVDIDTGQPLSLVDRRRL